MYEQALVTFVDVLGFRSLVASLPADDIAKTLDKFRHYAAGRDADLPDGPQVRAFSDCVVRVVPASARSGLFYELVDLLHAQGELAVQGVLVRGGLSVGEVHVSESNIFGPAFIRAYELESRFAIYPRIAVDPAVIHALNNGTLARVPHHDAATEAEYVRELLRMGPDGVWFLDYLRAFARELDDPDLYGEYLEKHAETALRVVDACRGESLTALHLKANWLVNYHNTAVAELPDEALKHWGYQREDLLIDEARLPTLARFG